jgi:hypothetical protein
MNSPLSAILINGDTDDRRLLLMPLRIAAEQESYRQAA